MIVLHVCIQAMKTSARKMYVVNNGPHQNRTMSLLKNIFFFFVCNSFIWKPLLYLHHLVEGNMDELADVAIKLPSNFT